MYSEILSNIIERLEQIEELTVLFRRRNVDGPVPLAMIAPASFSVTGERVRTNIKGNLDFVITLYAESFPELLALIERVESAVIRNEKPPKTISLEYQGFRLAQTEDPSTNIEPAELRFQISLIRNL